MNSEHHEETGAMSEATHAVGYANSLVGRFTAQETLRRGKAAVEHYRDMGLISFPEDRASPVLRQSEPEQDDSYQLWREEQAI